jgi:hypothetical protein
MARAGASQGNGAGSNRCTARHHVVHQQERSPSDRRRVRNGEGIYQVFPTLMCGKTGLMRGVRATHERAAGQERAFDRGCKHLGQDERLVVAALLLALAVQRDRHDQIRRWQIGNRAGNERRKVLCSREFVTILE